MRKKCSGCGLPYPDIVEYSTCRNCGSSIERASTISSNLKPNTIEMDNMWYDWRNKMFSAPPRPLREDDWYKACAVFNGCAICGSESIDEKFLFVPTYLGGKLYVYNVLPTCSFCAKRISDSRLSNPLKPMFTLANMEPDRILRCMYYLESLMLDVVFEEFNWEEDSVELVIRVVEDTSNLPFDGVWARRLFDPPKRTQVEGRQKAFESFRKEEVQGISWRLLDA